MTHGEAQSGRRIVFVQHGDYAEAVERFATGGGETYFAQRYSVRAVADLAAQGQSVAVICIAEVSYDRKLSNEVRAMAVTGGADGVIAALEDLDPTDLVLRTPRVELLRWALRRGVRTLPMLADSFQSGLRRWWAHRRLARLLNDPRIEWVANHNVNASRSLEKIGVDPRKIVPWDWPMSARPEDNPPKSLPSMAARRIVFVGVHSEAKGIGDVIEALAGLRTGGMQVTMTSVGGGDLDLFRRMAQGLGVGEQVTFTGRVEHERATSLMRDADAVIVPSRHEYPEGLPMTIYDAFISRTPLVVSDHPMFRGKVKDGESGLVFRAGDARSLADAVRRLFSDSALYGRLSRNGVEAFRAIECPAKWADVVRHWLLGGAEDRAWLAAHALSTGRYA